MISYLSSALVGGPRASSLRYQQFVEDGNVETRAKIVGRKQEIQSVELVLH